MTKLTNEDKELIIELAETGNKSLKEILDEINKLPSHKDDPITSRTTIDYFLKKGKKPAKKKRVEKPEEKPIIRPEISPVDEIDNNIIKEPLLNPNVGNAIDDSSKADKKALEDLMKMVSENSTRSISGDPLESGSATQVFDDLIKFCRKNQTEDGIPDLILKNVIPSNKGKGKWRSIVIYTIDLLLRMKRELEK